MEISLYSNPSRVLKIPNFPKNPRIIARTTNTVSCRVKGSISSTKTNPTNLNFYNILSLGSKKAGIDEIKKAYRSMALQYHPDLCPPSAKEESTRKFVELRKAYETLSDPESRDRYDYELGLVDSVGFGSKGGVGCNFRDRRRSRKVWEDQLSQLKKRSNLRMRRKR